MIIQMHKAKGNKIYINFQTDKHEEAFWIEFPDENTRNREFGRVKDLDTTEEKLKRLKNLEKKYMKDNYYAWQKNNEKEVNTRPNKERFTSIM